MEPLSNPREAITAVILAGGRARRMGGEDKGLIKLLGRPLLEYIISSLHPQVGSILVNANRNLDCYRNFGYPVIEDILGDYFGPLVGMATGMQAAGTPLLLAVPCDSPLMPTQIGMKLYRSMAEANAEICVAHDGSRLQPVFALLRCELLPHLLAYLDGGGRKIDTWYAQHRMVAVDFSSSPEVFMNLNTPQDKQALEELLLSRIAPH